MKRACLFFVLATVVSAGDHAAVASYFGVWVNVDSTTREITRLEIKPQISSAKGALVEMRIWSRCQPRDCDWGTNLAGYRAGKVTVQWEQEADRVRQELILQPDGRLKLESDTRFADRSGSQKHRSTSYFTRQQAEAN